MTDKPTILVADGTIYESPDGSRWRYSMEKHRWLSSPARGEMKSAGATADWAAPGERDLATLAVGSCSKKKPKSRMETLYEGLEITDIVRAREAARYGTSGAQPKELKEAGLTSERAEVLQVPSGVALEWEAMLTLEEDTADWSAGLGDGYELHDYWCALVPSTPINSTPAPDEIEFCEDAGNDISIQLPGGQHVLVRADYYGRLGRRMLQILCYEHGEDEPVAKIRYSRVGKLEEILFSETNNIRLFSTGEFNTPWELERGEE